MKGGLVGIGLLMLLVGAIWILQGVNILPGSIMTGDPFWAVMGLLCVGLGGFLLYRGLGRRGRS
ncbi:MAG: hypothetical protein ABIO92_09175 [Chloroflexia bacterium]